MLKWSRTPPQPGRPTVPGVSGEPQGEGKGGEVTPTPNPRTPKNKMDVELHNGVGSTSESQVTTKYIKRASNLTRTDSGKSSRSNKSLGTLSAFDPESAGTLARDTEVTYSMYDVPSADTHEVTRGSSSFGAIDPHSSSQQAGGGGISTSTVYKSSTTRTSGTQNGDITINGDLNVEKPSTSSTVYSSIKSEITNLSSTGKLGSGQDIANILDKNLPMDKGGKEIKSTKMTTTTTTTKGISASDSKIQDLSPDAKETNESIISTLDNLLVDLDDHDKSFDETMVTASLDRKLITQRPKNPAKKVGAFSMRSTFDESPLDKKSVSNTSLHDEKFKGDLSTKLINGHQNKTNLSDPHLNTTSTYSSIKREITNLSSTGKLGSGQDIANILDKNLPMTSSGLTNGVVSSDEIAASYNGHDPGLISNEGTSRKNSKTSSSVISSITAQTSGAVGDRSSAAARRTSQESTSTVTRTASQKSDQNNNLSRPTSRATERSEVRSSIARTESGRSTSPPQFKVRDIRGSLSRPSSSLSGGDRSSSAFGAYSPNRGSYSSSPTRDEVSVSSTNIVTTSSGRVKRVDSGASASSRQGTESKRTSVISTASSAGVAAGAVGLEGVAEDPDKASEKSTSQRTSVISNRSRSSITNRPPKPSSTPLPSSTSVSRTGSVASQGSKVSSRPASGRSRRRSTETASQRSSVIAATGTQRESQVSKTEGQVSRSESQLSRASSNTSGSSTSSAASYNFSAERKPSKGSDTDDKFIDSVDTEQRSELQKSEVTVVEKFENVYMDGEKLKTERAEKEERISKGEALPISSYFANFKPEQKEETYHEVYKTTENEEKRKSSEPIASTSSPTETSAYDSVFKTNDDTLKSTGYTGYTTQSSYGSLTSADSTGDRSFRKSASDLLDEFKSKRLGSAESTLDKSYKSDAGGASATSTASRITTTSTSTITYESNKPERPSDINLMGVSSLEEKTDSLTRDKHYDSLDRRQTYDAADSNASGGQQQIINGEKSPKSPIVEEAEKAVTAGTVNKLSKDVFANLNLTGRFIDPSTLERRAKTPDPSDEKEGEPEKKYKFLVEGIDIPAQEEEIQAEKASEERAELSPSLDSLERRPKGFSYVKIDSGLAGEIEKRAKTASSKKPHEAIEVKKASSEKIDESHYESLELKAAKAKLHRQIIQSHQQNYPSTDEVESAAQSLREARSKLHKQIVERKITSSEEVEESAHSAGVSAEPSYVGGSQTQTESGQQQQQVLQQGRGRQGQAATATTASAVSRVEPSGHKLVTPVNESTTVISTSTVREETAKVPQAPPPPAIVVPSQSQTSSNKHTTTTTTKSSISKTSTTTKQAIHVEDIGEDISEDYKDKTAERNEKQDKYKDHHTQLIQEISARSAKHTHQENNDKVPVCEEEIVPKHCGLLFDHEHTQEHTTADGQSHIHTVHHSGQSQSSEAAVGQGRSYEKAEVIEVLEPFIAAEKRRSERTGGAVRPHEHTDSETCSVCEDHIHKHENCDADCQWGHHDHKHGRDKIDDAFDRLERESKHKHDEHEQLLEPRASTSTASGVNNRTAAGAGAPGRQKTSTTSEGLTDQLSPDSAYQSAAASPIFVTTTNVKDLTNQQYLRPQQEPIMVQRGEELAFTAAPPMGGGVQQYESRKMMMKNTKMSSKSSKQMINGETVQQAESRELSERQMQYENSGRPNDDGLMISSSRNESVAYRGAGPEPARAIGGGPSATNTINHPIQMNGDVTGAQYPSMTVDSTRIMNSAQTDYNADVRHHQPQHNIRAQPQHGGGGGGYSASSSEGFNTTTTNRQQDDLHYQQQQRTGVTRKASHLSSSSAGSGGQRIVQLRPLTVDVNMANRGGTTQGPAACLAPVSSTPRPCTRSRT